MATGPHIVPALPPLSADSVNLPFLGSRPTPHATFQYLLQDWSGDSVVFAIPRWVVNREHFESGAQVNFHLPFVGPSGVRQEGEVTEAVWDNDLDAQRCTARLVGTMPIEYPVYASLESRSIVFSDVAGQPADPVELVRVLFRDLALLKRGTRVYFKHIIPLFSRLGQLPAEEYGELRRIVLNEIRQRIVANIEALEGWRARVEDPDFAWNQLPEVVDLETLRAAVEAEINNELFGTTFEAPVIRPYLDAIRLLERKVHLDYNTLVLLYAATL